MSNLLKVIIVVLLVVVSAMMQIAVWAYAFRVTSNLEWYPVQLVALAFDGMFILVAWRFLCRKPSFTAAALFVLAGNIVLLLLALLAREAPYRFPEWFIP